MTACDARACSAADSIGPHRPSCRVGARSGDCRMVIMILGQSGSYRSVHENCGRVSVCLHHGSVEGDASDR